MITSSHIGPSRVISYLYVEDNDDIRESIESLIASDTRQITAVASAETALSLIAQSKYDVLMTDISLPGMQGTELARRWLAVNDAGWVIFCTGYDLKGGLETLGKNVRSALKTLEPEELDALLAEVDARIEAAT
ncbi:MAG: response regulator [Candidatus Dactylopiibacterium sp.]|nr:response regulator [Candidatus Dactylopiibacterium sp.]